MEVKIMKNIFYSVCSICNGYKKQESTEWIYDSLLPAANEHIHHSHTYCPNCADSWLEAQLKEIDSLGLMEA